MYVGGRWQAPQGRVTEERTYEPEDLDRQVADFVAGTVFASGALLLGASDDEPEAPPPLFVVTVEPDTATFTAAPVLRDALAELDRVGLVALNETLRCAASWSLLTKPEAALVKLKLDFVTPVQGSARIILLGENYSQMWRHIAAGGMVGLSTMDRIQLLAARPGVTLADGYEACVPIGVASSPALQRMIEAFGWPR